MRSVGEQVASNLVTALISISATLECDGIDTAALRRLFPECFGRGYAKSAVTRVRYTRTALEVYPNGYITASGSYTVGAVSLALNAIEYMLVSLGFAKGMVKMSLPYVSRSTSIHPVDLDVIAKALFNNRLPHTAGGHEEEMPCTYLSLEQLEIHPHLVGLGTRETKILITGGGKISISGQLTLREAHAIVARFYDEYIWPQTPHNYTPPMRGKPAICRQRTKYTGPHIDNHGLCKRAITDEETRERAVINKYRQMWKDFCFGRITAAQFLAYADSFDRKYLPRTYKSLPPYDDVVPCGRDGPRPGRPAF